MNGNGLDLISIIQALHDIIFGGAATSSAAGKLHSTGVSVAASAPYYLINFFAKYAVFAFLFSIAMIFVVVLYARRYGALRAKVIAKTLPVDGAKESDASGANVENPKWKIVQSHINSPDAANWKLAILEADIILNDLLDVLRLPGDGVGEKLKAVDPADFTTIQDAWEAHKIRNAIAHEGSDFLINEREAKRIIGLYQKVFEEFEII